MAAPHDDRRVSFLRAALRCFARYGYRRTSMETIARAADVSRPALYQYYRGKEEIFRAAVGRGLDDLASRAETEARAPGEPTDRLLAVLGLVLGMYDLRGEPADHFRAELIDETYARAGDLWQEFEQRLISALSSVLRAAEDLDGRGAGTNEAEMAALLLYGTKGIALHVDDQRERQKLLRGFVALTARGLSLTN